MADERASASGLVSILMPCCGQLEYTRLSVLRIMRYSRQPFEVLFVDAGSLDGTRDYLAGVAAGASVRVEILRSSQEADFAELVSKALTLAHGSFVAWVNNDVLVTEMWLQQLVGLATANDIIGVVGPMANMAPEQQRVARVPYRLSQGRSGVGGVCNERLDTQVVDRWALEYRQANQGQWLEVERIDGFCWLCKREVLARADFLEKGFEEGILDAGRLSARVHQAGYRLACCRDMYVHHFGANLLQKSRP
jgi:GT2 family glycosyltransferase